MCTAIWIAGLIVNIVRMHTAKFQPWAMLGGFLWATGNMTVVPIVSMIGLSMGLLTWGLVCMISGWAAPNFGLFGLKPEHMHTPTASALNYVGVAIAALGMIPYAFVRSGGDEDGHDSEKIALVATNSDAEEKEKKESNFFAELPPMWKKILGFGLSICAGLLYGNNFDPPKVLSEHSGNSTELIDYTFSHFSGIFATSTFYLVLYCALKKNKPQINPQIILPGFVSGAMWAVAQIAAFLANSDKSLPLTVIFPIISTGPGVIGSLWGIFLFREIRGVRNFLFLGVAFSLTIVGITLLTLGKHLDHKPGPTTAPPVPTNATSSFYY